MSKLLPDDIDDNILDAMTAAYENNTSDDAMRVAVDVLRQHLPAPVATETRAGGRIMSPHASLSGWFFVQWPDGSIALIHSDQFEIVT